MKKILFVCEFVRPGGYHAIAEGLATGWAHRGVDVTMIGRGWDQAEHNYPFQILPTQREYITAHTTTLARETSPDWIVFMMDIPKIVSMFDNIIRHDITFNQRYKCAGVFPVESSPVSRTEWVAGLHRFAMRFTFTDFGVEQCQEEKLPVHKIPVGLSAEWYALPKEEIVFKFPWPYVLMVAKNQLRKNQHGAMLMAKKAQKHLVMVTDPGSADGWDLKQLAKQTGLGEWSIVLDQALISRDQLKYLYTNAESLLLPSLAEGIGLPLYEAQALGCPVVATNCCAIPEAVADKSGLITVANITPYPWGNTYHYWPSVEHGAELLQQMEQQQRMRYHQQTWQQGADQMLQKLDAFSEAVK